MSDKVKPQFSYPQYIIERGNRYNVLLIMDSVQLFLISQAINPMPWLTRWEGLPNDDALVGQLNDFISDELNNIRQRIIDTVTLQDILTRWDATNTNLASIVSELDQTEGVLDQFKDQSALDAASIVSELDSIRAAISSLETAVTNKETSGDITQYIDDIETILTAIQVLLTVLG